MRKTNYPVLALILLAAGPVAGAELQLHARCQPKGAVVTLGDVADVLGADPQQADRLAATELFPAPAPGRQRTVKVREIQDLLLSRQVNLTEHRFSGSGQVVVEGQTDARSAPQTAVSSSLRKRAERVVGEAVERYLQKTASASASWNVEVTLADAQVKSIPPDASRMVVRGGEPPWTGSQRFEIGVDTPDGPSRLSIRADVAVRQPVIVLAAALSRGAVVREADVQVVSASAVTDSADAAHTLDEVVGKETLRAIPAGTVLQSPMLRAPLAVRRGEIITVYSRSPGIRVRTTARAREDGSLGELITVESLSDRKKVFSARVAGIQEAEVYARAVQSDPQMGRLSSSPGTTGTRSEERNSR